MALMAARAATDWMHLWAAGKATALENCARQAAQGRIRRGVSGIGESGEGGSAGGGGRSRAGSH